MVRNCTPLICIVLASQKRIDLKINAVSITITPSQNFKFVSKRATAWYVRTEINFRLLFYKSNTTFQKCSALVLLSCNIISVKIILLFLLICRYSISLDILIIKSVLPFHSQTWNSDASLMTWLMVFIWVPLHPLLCYLHWTPTTANQLKFPIHRQFDFLLSRILLPPCLFSNPISVLL